MFHYICDLLRLVLLFCGRRVNSVRFLALNYSHTYVHMCVCVFMCLYLFVWLVVVTDVSCKKQMKLTCLSVVYKILMYHFNGF